MVDCRICAVGFGLLPAAFYHLLEWTYRLKLNPSKKLLFVHHCILSVQVVSLDRKVQPLR